MLNRAALASALLIAGTLTGLSASPARADDGDPMADMGYAFELQNWAVPAATGAVGFTGMMHTLTLTDRSGAVMALFTSAMKTNANQYYAEQEARRRRENFYHYQQVIDEPKEGVRLGLVLGTGAPGGLNGPGLANPTDLDAKLARMRIDGDLFGLLGGTIVFHTGLEYFQAGGRSSTGGTFGLSSFTFPIGLAWRIAPLPVPGLVFEPFADADLGTSFNGVVPARNLGLRVNYFLHPSIALSARAEAAALPVGGGVSLPKGTYADVKLGALGAQLVF